MEHYVYVYLDPRKNGIFQYQNLKFENEPFYIGKGSRKRHLSHINRVKKWINDGSWNFKIRITPKHSKIKSILEDGVEPIVIKLSIHTVHEHALLLERRTIRKIGRLDLNNGPLLNLTNGGEGTSGLRWKYTKEQLKRCKEERRKNPPRKGMSNSPEMRKKQSLAKLGKKFTDAHKANLSKIKSKPIEVFRDGIKIGEYENMLIAAEKIGFPSASAYPHLRKGTLYKKKYLFKYLTK